MTALTLQGSLDVRELHPISGSEPTDISDNLLGVVHEHLDVDLRYIPMGQIRFLSSSHLQCSFRGVEPEGLVHV